VDEPKRDFKSMRLSYLRTTSYQVLIAAAAAVGALFLPPFHTLTHEFAAMFTLVTGAAAFFTAGTLAWRAGREVEPGAAAWRGLAWGAAGAAGALAAGVAVILTANAAGFHCNVESGLPHLFVTWTPAIGFALVVGSLTGSRGWRLRWRLAVLVAFTLLTLAHDAWQLYSGPRLLPVDFFLGDLNGLSQRASMDITGVHFLNRAFVAGLTLWLWASATGPHLQLAAYRRRAALICGVLLVAVVAIWGSYFGVGVGRANLHAEYGQVRSDKGIAVYHSGSPRTLTKLDAIAREAAWNMHWLTNRWNVVPEHRLRIYVFDSAHDMERLTGLREPHAGLGEVYVDLANARGTSLRHEIVHALHRSLHPNIGVLLSRGFLEGTATAFADYYAESPGAHTLQAAALADGHLPKAQDLVAVGGFRNVAEHKAYASAGSFFGFLVIEYGTERFKTLQRTMDFEAVYGKPAQVLDLQWRDFLSALDVPPATSQEAQHYFDPVLNPGFASELCPKVGDIPEPLEDEALYLRMTGHYDAAAAAYFALYERQDSVTFGRWAVRCLEMQGAIDEALALTETLSARPGLRRAELNTLMGDRVRLLVRARDWQALYAVYDVRAQSGLPVAYGSVMGEACLRNPALRTDYASIMFESDPIAEHELWENMLAAAPDFEPLAYLYAAAGVTASAPVDRRGRALLRAAELSPEHADHLGKELWQMFEDAMANRAWGWAERAADAMARLCNDAHYRYLGTLALERMEFERGSAS
jgi:hypothetical protein